MMGLWGIILASLVNLFLQSSGLQFAVSIMAVVVFTGLTAYDTQKIKGIYYQLAGRGELASKYAIMGALNLYLDFINLFIMLLRFFGDPAIHLRVISCRGRRHRRQGKKTRPARLWRAFSLVIECL